MDDEKKGLDQVAHEVQKVLESNRKFLARIMDEDFAAEDEEEKIEDTASDDFEEL